MGLNCTGPLIYKFFSINTLERSLEICNSLKNPTNKPCSLEMPKEKRKHSVCHECMRFTKILVYCIIYYHKVCTNLLLKVKIYQNLHKHLPKMTPFAAKRNVNKQKDAELNHNCIKLTEVHTVLVQHFYSHLLWLWRVSSSVMSIHLKLHVTLIIST